MTKIHKLLLLLIVYTAYGNPSWSQDLVEDYAPKKNDYLKIGKTEKDVLPYIQKGYTLMLPEAETIKGVLVFLEDSGYDKKNRSAKQMYQQASEEDFAVLSVSTEIPFDFYFSKASALSTHQLIQQVFAEQNLPNNNVFFIGIGLGGHRAMRHIKFMKEEAYEFQLNIKGIVICNSILDWTRKWHQYDREIRNNRNDLWEPKFVNYMLETHLGGTPRIIPDAYNDFSTYSYFDEANENIKLYTNYVVRAYIEPAIKYWLEERLKTLYENNSPDMVGLLAELELAGNQHTELIVLQPEDNPSPKKTPDTTWDAINKDELMDWIQGQTKH
ncbi:MAG: hypothetical protein AAFX55_14990 [Bacteroidota bacterium]